jgi:3-phenylpropionate/cinnamic acid dioxygenase small subunit
MGQLPSSAPADDLAIRSLIARVAQLADTGDLDDYIDCFTPGAKWDMPGAPRQGHADIRAGAEDRRASGGTGPGSASRHAISTVAVTVTGDAASSRSYFQFFVETNTATPRLQVVGQYDDEFVRGEDGWRLDVRSVSLG